MNLLAQMSPVAPVESVRLPASITPQHIEYLQQMAALQVLTAVVLQVVFIFLVIGTIALAFNWRKTSLGCNLLAGAGLVFIPSGLTPTIGWALIAASAAGLVINFLSTPKQQAVAAG